MASYNAAVDDLREREYPMLKDCVYLDHAGSTPCSKSLMDAFATEMTSTLFGNPHSASWPSQLSASRIDDVRLSLLTFFNADPADYDLVFVANATAGVKLVVEALRSLPQGYSYAYHQASHTSLVGAREDAHSSACLDDRGVEAWLRGVDPFHDASHPSSATLFAYPAQSHLDGRRHPLSWAKRLKEKATEEGFHMYTLLDAASFGATSQLDLGSSGFAADFVVLSLYKIFGFPDLGVLIVRRSAEPVFDHRRYFGGGTVDMVVCGQDQWHARKSQSLHERLEDGTLPFQSIMAAGLAIKMHNTLFGSMSQISAHTGFLADALRERLRSLRHGNGRPVCVIYNAADDSRAITGAGPIVSFNILSGTGDWVSLGEFEKLASLRKIHVRTGSMCCPGGIAAALGLEPWELKRNLSAGFRCGAESDLLTGKPSGVIRASLGAMSSATDVDKLIEFIREFFVDDTPTTVDSSPERAAAAVRGSPSLRVKAITVYPIKSCGGFVVPTGLRWGVRAEGLAWDREWCLVHRGSGQALSQKRYPKMALLRPVLDLENGILRVAYHGISAQTYASDQINDFFTKALGVPCSLARFPPGGLGLSSRSSKARPQKHQRVFSLRNIPGSFPEMPSPPDSDSEQQRHSKILLSNESPILLVHSCSVDALNREIRAKGGGEVAESTFRANIVVESLSGKPGEAAYSEDSWSEIRVGNQGFKLLGACRRCQMVCVDQETAERRQEPLTTLAKTRRFDGRVYFGTHMRHEPRRSVGGRADFSPSIQVGEPVTVYDARRGQEI
ncbi:hypothetical protein CDD83_8187 [Cordyceps sp. RAO-2017]|nr:hypothetical protein CDD83_8187 [Cordyceps sp. RAO-2017]